MRIKHIDGIRGISIIAVVLFHAFPDFFKSGYLGVDYFLVVSGFVISKKYFINENKFDFKEFWTRRIIRLYPSLIICILLITPISFFLMNTDYFENFLQSIIASLFGLNNILLLLTSGYWDASNELKPLYTTWSLGLEEQFYLFLSLLFLSINITFSKKKFLISIISISLLSYLLCLNGSFNHKTFHYLMLPGRLWEFFIGVLACYLSLKPIKFARFLSPLSLLISIIFLFINFDPNMLSPKPIFIFPLLAIGYLCLDSEKSMSSRILSFRPLSYIGIASYSIYLYHQPVLAFFRLNSFFKIKNEITILIVILSFLIGIFMYEYIEKRQIYLQLINKIRIKYFGIFHICITSISIIFISIISLINIENLFRIRFPYLLINDQIPKGFLGGKGYTDIPKKFIGNNFSERDHTIKLLFIGNSRIRDLINSFMTSDKLNKEGVEIVYIMQFNSKDKYIKNNIQKADIIISQILEIDYKTKKSIFIYAKERENFIHNINPLVLMQDKNRRKNIKILVSNSPKNLLIKEDTNLYKLNDIFSFIDNKGFLNLTDKGGNIISFDGIHLSESGAKVLGKSLEEEPIFNEISKKLNKNIYLNNL